MTTAESEERSPAQQQQQLFMRADEVDAGTTVVSTGSEKPLSALTPSDGSVTGTSRPRPPPRPALRRDGSTSLPPPPPPSQPPPAPPPQSDQPTDSLTLPQLRQIVSQFPKVEQRAYAYQYRDAEDYSTEIDEWFHYTELEQDREYLLSAREAFEQKWRPFCHSELQKDDASWTKIPYKHRLKFVTQLIPEITSSSANKRQEALATAYYVLSGVWSVTAGLVSSSSDGANDANSDRFNQIQIEWMHKGVDLVYESGAIDPIYTCLRNVLDQPYRDGKHREGSDEGRESVFDDSKFREISLCMSCLYIVFESTRSRQADESARKIRNLLMALTPNPLVYLVRVISRLRWDELYNIPLLHALQILWKGVLLFFGDVGTHLEHVKSILQPRTDPFSSEAAHPILTASPLDYHLFRQEVTSKYPAYNPPLPLVPLEIEQKSMLPPLPHAPRHDPWDNMNAQSSRTTGASILHQPVHIATPAPSPPPSPAGPGGKGGKKQNYQTNQNFPFLYPPLDSSSNNIGGKGTTEIQDSTAAKKWGGSSIPASILEAGELFASRMRMTRAMRQLWKERDLFMKYDRGWDGLKPSTKESAVHERKVADAKSAADDKLEDTDLQDRMNAVEEFFHHSLPDFQSLVIVMMKVMLTNVQDIAVRSGGFQDGQANGLNRTKSNPNMTQSQNLPMPPPPPRPEEVPFEELDNIRSREISQKAISATLFLMLKWFKISHILKFEYITQLLLDSNYIQLTLKYFAHQNLEDLVAFKYDRDDLTFWHYCHLHSDHPPLTPTSPASGSPSEEGHSSADEAIPPPIQRHRRSPSADTDGNLPSTTYSTGQQLTASPEQVQHSLTSSPPSQQQQQQQQSQQQSNLPTVDELGNPLNPLPQTPITTFSPRQFQTSIHLLRTLQKLTRSKSHRVLLLVQFKSSQILRRVLRVPDPMLRLYVLKLFKSQVPYCGRKWRQSNMRVITAIYLHCRPELRDEWLAGMHDTNVEGEVDEAVPLEWALRGLTFWWMKRTFPDIMKNKSTTTNTTRNKSKEGDQGSDALDGDGNVNVDIDVDIEGGQEIEDEERDFFQRELDAMGWGMANMNFASDGDVAFGEEAPGVAANGVNGVDHHSLSQHVHHGGWEGGSNHGGVGGGGGSAGGGMEVWQ